NGYITRNYVDKNNMYEMSLSLFSHEDWHAHNDEIKWRLRFKYTPFEYYKLCMHDEISANIAALLTTRYQYIHAENKKEFIKKFKGRVFEFYYKEVDKGTINPLSANPLEREKEYKLIANGVQQVWMDRCAKGYMPAIYRMLQRYVERNGLVANSRKNYNYVRGYMYKIGGVDFSKYMKHDIVPEDERVLLSDGLKAVKSMSDGGIDIMNYVNDCYPLLQEVGIGKQSESFQHLLIAAKLKYSLRNKSEEEIWSNPQLVDMYYQQIMSKFARDKTYRQYIDNFPTISEQRSSIKITDKQEYNEIIGKMYTLKGMDLRRFINDFSDENVPVKTQNYGKFNGTYTNWLLPVEFLDETAQKPQVKYNGPMIIEPDKKQENVNIVKRRLSAWQFVETPNYREPILTLATQDDEAKIIKAIADFDAIPQVLKECDTEAQKAYYASLEKVSQKKQAKVKKEVKSRNLCVRLRKIGRKR
ncbi:MAG: hypothetical protein II830_00935, partial [Alphaproteobacteria bacterium]|nr:hypothetical protein [Alphaproteobacteria bacterium]